MNWKTIDSVPTDGTMVDLYGKETVNGTVVRAKRFTNCYRCKILKKWVGIDGDFDISHWMELPEPPLTSTES